MDIRSFIIRPLMVMLVLLVVQMNHSYFAQKAYADFPRISPDRLQFFEYETIRISCEELSGMTEWRVVQKLDKKIPEDSSDCGSPAPSCTISVALASHSGEYWCEDTTGQRSGAVNITITAGSVILEVPALPVMEGCDVILHCTKQESESTHIPDFYKDGVKLGAIYEDKMTLQNISKSDEGLYKCISSAGESPESWLRVLQQSNKSNDEIQLFQRPSFLLWAVISISLAVTLLLVMGLFLCCKYRVFSSKDSIPAQPLSQDCTGAEGHPDTQTATYAVVKKCDENSGGDDDVDPNTVTYAQVKTKKRKQAPKESKARRKSSSLEPSVVYSSINHKPSVQD